MQEAYFVQQEVLWTILQRRRRKFGGIFRLDSDFPLRNSYLNPRRRREKFEHIMVPVKEYLYQ